MSSLLGGITPATFLRRYWQKRPYLVRDAVPGFAGIVDRHQLFSLATRPDVTSRLVVDHGTDARRARWERHDGPFGALGDHMLPRRAWTLLVHGLESLVPGGWELLRAFSFVPAARIDDLMVSLAAEGGSVGPHDDRYDVFLLQGPGRRRWRIARGGDRQHDPSAAIKVLADFEPEEEWVLEPGDMLYLPPGVAHHGVAEDPCFTYSVGFLAPSAVDLVQSFLGWYAGGAEVDREALYGDPQLAPPRDPFVVPDGMIAYARATVQRALAPLKKDPRLVEDFLGCFLTRPRPGTRFTPQATTRAPRGPLRLALPTRALWRADRLFLNGVAYALRPAQRKLLDPLVRTRACSLTQVDTATQALLQEWLRLGWIVR